MATIIAENSVKRALDLAPFLSPATQILVDPQSPTFKESMQRWSDENVQTPSVIIKPSTDSDIQHIVKTATDSQIPITIKSGGNSPWSTAAPPSWIIDLSLLTSISLSPKKDTITIQSGVLTKTLNTFLSTHNIAIPCPTGGQVGYIPFLLGGGANPLAGIYGIASDSLISARLVTATGEILTVSREENEDLFYALKGAGWYFGIVTEVTVKVYQLEHEIISWTCIFPTGRVEEVAGVLEQVVNGIDGRSSGMCAIVAPPGAPKPVIIVNLTHFRPLAEAEQIMAPLLSLSPVQNIKKTIAWENITDASDAISKHGGLNTIVSCGLQKFDGKQFVEALASWEKMVEKAPGTNRSMFMFTFYSNEYSKTISDESSAWSHRNVPVWFMGFMSAPDMEANKVAIKSANEVVKYCQKDQKDEEIAMFPNHTRRDNLKYRYGGAERLAKLKALKETWDPEGVFTRQLMDD